jgi:hypothetical protein
LYSAALYLSEIKLRIKACAWRRVKDTYHHTVGNGDDEGEGEGKTSKGREDEGGRG